MPSSPQDYMFWEKGRWSRKARRADDLQLARDMARIELDADTQRNIQRSELEHNKRMTEMGEQARLNRDSAAADAQMRLDAEKKRIEAQTEAEKQRTKYGAELDSNREYEARDSAGKGLALDLLDQVNPVTGQPFTQAEALAKGAMMVRGAETAKPREMMNLAEKYKALFPRTGEAARAAQEAEIGASRTDLYKQGLVRDQSLFESGKLGGAMPYAGKLGESAATRELAVDEAVRGNPMLGAGSGGAAVVRGEQDRATKAAALDKLNELQKSQPTLLQRLFGNRAQPPVQPQRRVFHFGPASTNAPADELSRKYGVAIQR